MLDVSKVRAALRLSALASIVVALLSLTLASADGEVVRSFSYPKTAVTTLETGDNEVGWTGEPITPSELFEQIPSATLIYRWDNETGDWKWSHNLGASVAGTLQVLEPGMAFTIRIEQGPVAWRRNVEPAVHEVMLYEGLNFVAWLGPDGWTPQQAARGVGILLSGFGLDGHWFSASALGELPDAAPTVDRGGGVWVNVRRSVLWVQPTGAEPVEINLLEGTPSSMRDFFSIYAACTNDLLAGRFGVDTGPIRISESPGRGGIAGGSSIRMGLRDVFGNLNQDRPELDRFRLMFHEASHIVQQRYGPGPSEVWQSEGGAIWMAKELQATLLSDLSLYPSCASMYDQEVRPWDRFNSNWVSDLTGILPRFLDDHRGGLYSAPYRTGHHAMAWLRRTSSSDDAPLEYFRLAGRYVHGPKNAWTAQPGLRVAHGLLFGTELGEFYDEFAEYLAPHLVSSDDDEPSLETSIAGTLIDENGEPIAGAVLKIASTANKRANVLTVDGGAFQSNGFYPQRRVEFVGIELPNGCYLYLHPSGFAENYPSDASAAERELLFGTPRARDLRITARTSQCREIHARVVDERGQPVVGVLLGVYNVGGNQTRGTYSTKARTDLEGRATVFGDGLLRVTLSNRCRVFYAGERSVRYHRNAVQVDSDALDGRELTIVISDDACA